MASSGHQLTTEISQRDSRVRKRFSDYTLVSNQKHHVVFTVAGRLALVADGGAMNSVALSTAGVEI